MNVQRLPETLEAQVLKTDKYDSHERASKYEIARSVLLESMSSVICQLMQLVSLISQVDCGHDY